jgi:hypothetical protein
LTVAEPEFTDTARAALLWVLWHHQGGSSEVGQAVRFALGKGEHDSLTKHEVTQAKRWASIKAGRKAMDPARSRELAGKDGVGGPHGC